MFWDQFETRGPLRSLSQFSESPTRYMPMPTIVDGSQLPWTNPGTAGPVNGGIAGPGQAAPGGMPMADAMRGRMGGGQAGGPMPPVPGPNASREEVKNFVSAWFASQGVTPRPTSVDYFTDKFFSDFKNDGNYLVTKLGTAEELPQNAGNRTGGSPLDAPLLKGYGQDFNYDPNKILDSPAFQAAMKRGIGALQNSAAAKGTVLSGGIMKDIADWTTGLGLDAIGADFNRALGTAEFNRGTQWGDSDRQFQRLSDFTRLGQGNAGLLQGATNTYGSQTGDTAAQQANNATNLGNATAGAALAGGNITDWRQLLQRRQPAPSSGY